MGALRNERTVRGRRPVYLGARRRNVCPSGPCLCTGAWPNIARLPAASLLEAVVASVVLLIVFAASLETVVRLTAGPSDGIVCAEADYRAACTVSEIRQGAFSEGKTERSYGWGTLTDFL